MTDKLKGIEPGCRYKVEFEAITKYVSVGIVNFEITPGTVTTISADEIAHPSFKIEPIEEPIKVGDRVLFGRSDYQGSVLAIHKRMAWVEYAGDEPWSVPVADLERVK